VAAHRFSQLRNRVQCGAFPPELGGVGGGQKSGPLRAKTGPIPSLAACRNSEGGASGALDLVPELAALAGAFDLVPELAAPAGALDLVPELAAPAGALDLVPELAAPAGALDLVPELAALAGAFDLVPELAALAGALDLVPERAFPAGAFDLVPELMAAGMLAEPVAGAWRRLPCRAAWRTGQGPAEAPAASAAARAWRRRRSDRGPHWPAGLQWRR
jgi:hypothetical protein